VTLKDQLRLDLQSAMRARDEHRKNVLRMALTAVQLAEVEKGADLVDEEILDVIRKEVRRREDALVLIRQAGREETVKDELLELDMLNAYLPQQLGHDEVALIVRQVIGELGADSPARLGDVMKAVMPLVKGKADGRLVNQVVRELLSA